MDSCDEVKKLTLEEHTEKDVSFPNDRCFSIQGQDQLPIVEWTGKRVILYSQLTKAQTVTYRVLCKQDGTPSVPFHVVHDLAKANPAGVHGVQYVGRGNVGMSDPESNGIEGDLEDKP